REVRRPTLAKDRASDHRVPPRPFVESGWCSPRTPGGAGATGYHVGVPTRILLAWPRGYCAGVERAIDTVERALRIHGPPVYVRKQIVHNIHVVRDLEAKGAVFVEDERDVPEGAVLILSAHGVAPEAYEHSARRRLSVIDATC